MVSATFAEYQQIFLDADLALEKLEYLISKKLYPAAREYLSHDSVRSALTAAYGLKAWRCYNEKLKQFCS